MSTQSQFAQSTTAATGTNTGSETPAARAGETLLRRTLLANSVFSALSGILLVVGAGPVAAFMGVATNLPFIVIGLGLLAFAVGVYRDATGPALQRQAVRMIFWLDVAWVVGSALILATDAFGLSSGGRWAIAGVADVILVLAILEYVGLRRLRA